MLLRALPRGRGLLERGARPADQAATIREVIRETLPNDIACVLLYDEKYELEDYQGGVPLVLGLRRQRHPRLGAAPVPRRRPAPGEDGVRLGHRLLEPLPTTCAPTASTDPRPRAAGGRGRAPGAARPACVREHRRRRLLLDRRRALDPRRALQHAHERVPARQPDLRPHQEAGLAHLARGTKSNTTPRGSALEGAEPAHRDARRAERIFVAQAVDWMPDVLYDIVRVRSTTRASRSCASSSAAPSGCPTSGSRTSRTRSASCAWTRAATTPPTCTARERSPRRWTRSRSASSTATRTCPATRTCAAARSCAPPKWCARAWKPSSTSSPWPEHAR